MCVYIYIYIYIYRERERDVYIYIYIYISSCFPGPSSAKISTESSRPTAARTASGGSILELAHIMADIDRFTNLSMTFRSILMNR